MLTGTLIKVKYKINAEYIQHPRRRNASGDRQTDRQTGCSDTRIQSIQYTKLSQVRQRRSRIIKSSSSVNLALRNCLSSSWALGAGDERPIIGVVNIHQHEAGLAHKQQIITTTTTTSSGGTVKKTTSVATSKKTSRYRIAMIGVVDKSGRRIHNRQ